MDMTSALLNGSLQDDYGPIFIEPPRYLGIKVPDDTVFRVNKAFYRFKNARGVWNRGWDKKITSLGFEPLKSDGCDYTRGSGSQRICVLMYVEDILVMGKEASRVCKAKRDLGAHFPMKDMGRVEYFLGVQFKNVEGPAVITQEGYVKQLLEKFGMGVVQYRALRGGERKGIL